MIRWLHRYIFRSAGYYFIALVIYLFIFHAWTYKRWADESKAAKTKAAASREMKSSALKAKTDLRSPNTSKR